MRLLVVDGNSIVNRAFYGIRPLTTKDGQFTNAIYGFLTMLEKIKTDMHLMNKPQSEESKPKINDLQKDNHNKLDSLRAFRSWNKQ